MSATEAARKRVLLVEGQRLLRGALGMLLRACDGLEVTGEVENGRAAIVETFRTKPDVVVLGLGLPAVNGLEVVRQIRTGGVHAKVIAVAGSADRLCGARMIRAGASAYLLRDCCAFEDLLLAVQAVCLGGRYLCSNVEEEILGDLMAFLAGDPRPEPPALSPRQRQVLRLYAEGKGTREIASLLRLSVKTVESHRKGISEKLGLGGVAEFAHYAIGEDATFP